MKWFHFKLVSTFLSKSGTVKPYLENWAEFGDGLVYLVSHCISLKKIILIHPSQSAITCSKLTIETLDQGVKYVQS